jgi:hypothetical protein
VQRNEAGQSEVAIDKRIDPPAPALDIPLHVISDDRASELLRGQVRHPFTNPAAAHI